MVGVDANLTGLDPADLNDNMSQSAARLMFEGLYMLDEHMKLQPQLAESYEASEDAKEFTFHLRKGVTFHDGTPFNAAAVKFSFDRAGNPENHLKRQSLYVMIDHTDVVDDYTVKMVLKYPFGAFVNNIAHPGALIVSPKSVQDFGKEVTRHPSGTGPYEFVSWSADTLKMKKNEHYWKPGLPKIDTITYRSVPENGARIAMLQAGEAQFIYPVPPEMIKALREQPDGHRVQRAVDPGPLCGAEQHAQAVQRSAGAAGAELCDRQAGVRQGGVQRLRRSDGLADAARCSASIRSRAAIRTIRRRRRRCWPRPAIRTGSRARSPAASRHLTQRGMQFVQQQLAAVGVKLKVEPLEAGVLTAKMFNVKKPEDATIVMLYGGWSSSTGDADWGMRPMLYTKSFPPVLSNLAWYSSPATDAAIEEGLGHGRSRRSARRPMQRRRHRCGRMRRGSSWAWITTWRHTRRSCTARSCGRISSSI